MTGNHASRLVRAARADGQGKRESSRPTTPTNNSTPTMNDMLEVCGMLPRMKTTQ